SAEVAKILGYSAAQLRLHPRGASLPFRFRFNKARKTCRAEWRTIFFGLAVMRNESRPACVLSEDCGRLSRAKKTSAVELRLKLQFGCSQDCRIYRRGLPPHRLANSDGLYSASSRKWCTTHHRCRAFVG